MRTILTIVVLLTVPMIASAQSLGGIELYAGGGIAVPWSSNDCSTYYTVDAAFSPRSLPLFKYSDTWSTGFNFGFGLGYPVTPDLSVILDLNYNSSNLDKTQLLKDLSFDPNAYVADVTMKMVAINANAKYVIRQFNLPVDPFVKLGAGYMGIAADDISILSSASTVLSASFKSQAALNTLLGVGVDIQSSESSALYVEVQYIVAYTRRASPFSSDNFSIVPVRVGIRGTF